MNDLGHQNSSYMKGKQAQQIIAELFPICRSITGNGVRETLKLLRKHIPLEIHEVPSGTSVFDWTVPKEWNVRDAYIKNSAGIKIVDFQKCNLHLASYSVPIHQKMKLAELKQHLFSIPQYPDWIPYKTTYYKESWGFCLSHNELERLSEGEYEVLIDTELKVGHLTYGELVLPGAITDEVLISCHVCHPSLCNDNLSGIAIAVLLAEFLMSFSRRYTYRFLFVPGTIGAITWLACNRNRTAQISHGMVLTGLGDPGPLTYKKSRRGDALVDKVANHVLSHAQRPGSIREFSPYGYDERQYCSPGFNLPVGRLSRTPFNEYPEYHTSADNLEFVQPSALEESLDALFEMVQILENNGIYSNLLPYCEPQLGKRGLYEDNPESNMAILWVLNLSDGSHSLFDIAEKSGLRFSSVLSAKNKLVRHSLLQEVEMTP